MALWANGRLSRQFRGFLKNRKTKKNDPKNRKMKEKTRKEADLRAGMLMYNMVDAPGGVEPVRVLQERLLGDKRVAEAPLAQRPTRTAKGCEVAQGFGDRISGYSKGSRGG